MKKVFTLLFVVISMGNFAQENTFQKKRNVKTDQDVYNEGQPDYSRVLIIPFEPKMYISSADKDIANKTSLTHQQIRENMRFGISDHMRHSIGKGLKTVSMLHLDTGNVAGDLAYIYNSIGYKYKPLPEKDVASTKTNQENANPLDKMKGSFNKLIKKEKEAKREEDGTRIKNGQIQSTVSYGEKFMNTSIHNPNLLTVLGQKYNADVFLFINELDIESAAAASQNGLSSLSYKRKVKVHYTIFDKNGKEIHGGASIVYMPSTTNDMNRIINNYFPQLTQNIADNLPQAYSSKLETEKRKEEAEKAKEQHEAIEKL